MDIRELSESIAKEQCLNEGYIWNELPEKSCGLFDGIPSKHSYRERAKGVINYLSKWGFGIYEVDNNFPTNNKFILLSEIFD